MKKNDLKTGMMVECRNGNVYTVMLGVEVSSSDVLVRPEGWMGLNGYDDNMKCRGAREWDIMKVYQPKLEAHIGHKDSCNLIWERDEEFTKEDLQVGMSVITRGGKRYDVCSKVDEQKITHILFCNDGTWRPLSCYEDNLMWCDFATDADIMKVYSDLQLVYEREK